MNEAKKTTDFLRRAALPAILAIVVVVATVLLSGSALIRIEDVTVGRILAGTYGTPDWRVQEMNPLLAQCLALLYRLIPSINWYGALLLALLALSAAAAMGLAARKPGGFVLGAIAVSPMLLLFTNAVQSTVVCAFCAAAGALLLMDSLAPKPKRAGGIVVGALLFVFAAMLSLGWTVTLAGLAAVCYLPGMRRDERIRGFVIGVPVMAIVALALLGYTSLMYGSPELSAYRGDYARYERLQHSSLKEESDMLLSTYSVSTYSDGQVTLDPDDYADVDDVVVPPHSFDAVGWNINDASMFFTRYGGDSKLTDPEALKTLEKEAKFISFDLQRLWSEWFTTVKKPQFLLLIAIFVAGALALLITSRRKGLLVLLAAVIAFGGHILMIARYYDTFADIAPFYLVGIAVLLYHLNGEDAKGWYHRLLAGRGLRMGISLAVLACFVAGMTGLWLYTGNTPANTNPYTTTAVNYIKAYIAENPDMLFVGDNPNDRYKPDTLAVPAVGEDQNLLAGSYDLYSPRAAALRERFSVDNPLLDSIGRKDIAYISMSFADSMIIRAITAYDLYLKNFEVLKGYDDYIEQVVYLEAYSKEEFDAILEQIRFEEEQAELLLEALQELEESGRLDEILGSDDHDDEAEGGGAAPGGDEPTAEASPEPAVSPSAAGITVEPIYGALSPNTRRTTDA